MDVSISAIIAQLINFAIIFWLFKKFLAKPLTRTIEDRRKLIHKLEHADAAYEEKMAEAKAKYDKQIQAGLEKKEGLIAEAGVIADKKKQQIISDAETKASRIIDDAERTAQSLHEELEQSFAQGVKKTSLLVVKKLLNKDKALKDEYIDMLVNEAKKER